MQQQGWTAGDGEAVCKLSRAGLIVGTVVDAKTKAPIQDFQIVGGHGFRLDNYVWDRDHLLRGSNGAYSYSYDGRYGGGHTRLLAEAPGYLPRVSPALSAFGWFTNDFELRKGEGPKGITARFVRGREDGPAAGARSARSGAPTARPATKSFGSKPSPRLVDAEITCLVCGAPLRAREEHYVLKYFFLGRKPRA